MLGKAAKGIEGREGIENNQNIEANEEIKDTIGTKKYQRQWRNESTKRNQKHRSQAAKQRTLLRRTIWKLGLIEQKDN